MHNPGFHWGLDAVHRGVRARSYGRQGRPWAVFSTSLGFSGRSLGENGFPYASGGVHRGKKAPFAGFLSVCYSVGKMH